MNKKLVVKVLTLAMTVGCLAGCGASKDETYLSGFKAEKYVTLGEYKGLAISAEKIDVNEEYIQSYIDYALSMDPSSEEITDRPVQDGDVVNIDYVGKKDGVAFDGGTAQGYDLEIGSGSFIPGFEDGLVGANIGDTVDLDLTFPEEYHSEELAGAQVVFTVTVNSITVKKVPELTDAYVQTLGLDGVSNVTEYREYVKKMLQDDADTTYESNAERAVLDAAMANCTFSAPPQPMIDRFNDTLRKNLENYATAYGMGFDDFMQYYYGMDADTYPAELTAQATQTAQQYIMLQAIADKEGIAVTEEELKSRLEEDSAEAGYASVEEFTEAVDAESYREYIMGEKVVAFLIENAVITNE